MKHFILLFCLSCLYIHSVQAQSNKKWKALESAPSFIITDVNGDTVNLTDYKGKKVLLTFYRSVGCPVCNLYFHELQEYADSFKLQNVIVMSVYESPASAIRQYVEGEDFYAVMIPDSTEKLYHLFGVQRSWWKMFKGRFQGVNKKIKKGRKLFSKKPKYDAHANRISADFLIDEHGKFVFAYYGKYFGDHISVEKVKEYLRE